MWVITIHKASAPQKPPLQRIHDSTTLIMNHKDVSPSIFLQLGTEMKRKKISSDKINLCRFKAWYGIDWKLMSVVWYLLWGTGWMKKNIKKRKPNPIHLLWALSFLKKYSKENEHAADVGKEAKTFWKWAWLYCEGIASLSSQVVSNLVFQFLLCLPITFLQVFIII